MVLIAHGFTIGSYKSSFRIDRLVLNWLHGQGCGIFFCKTPKPPTQCIPEMASLLQRFTASLYKAGALKITGSTISLGSYWYHQHAGR